MPDQALSKAVKKQLRSASRDEVEALFVSRVSSHVRREKWITATNRYRTQTISRLKDDVKKKTINHQHLKDYIASSCPMHAVDGWSFLGRAIDCVCRGDADSARHLAYYAELRAAMSLLASEGIGIFATRHFVVDRNGECRPITKGCPTHTFVWRCLDYWAGLQRAADLVGQIVTPRGICFSEWLEGGNLRTGTGPLAQKWLRNWGLDLNRMAQDREARNEASYRPTQFRGAAALSADDVADFLTTFWELLEPSAHGGFDKLDRYLVRAGFREAYRGMHGPWAHTQAEQYQAVIEGTLERLGVTDPHLAAFLSEADSSADPTPLREAVRGDSVESSRHHLQVISRAMLLLRIAVGSARRLLDAAGVDSESLGFWWRGFGEGCALWEDAKVVAQPTDLWADIEERLDELGSSGPGGADESLRTWRMSPGRMGAILDLSGCELVSIWGLVG